MNNVFLQLRNSFTFKPEVLKKLVAAEPNKQIIKVIDNFFSLKHDNVLDYANLVRNVLGLVTIKQTIQKLLHLLVYFSTLIESDQALKIFDSLKALNISPYILVKFYSFIFKSIQDQKMKKWLIINSLEAMQKQQKTSPFTSFVQNFELIVNTINLQSNQLIEIYCKFIKYLEKHVIYKKLTSNYVFIALNLINKANQNSQMVSKLFIKAIYSDNFNDEAINILNKQSLKSHELYPILQARMTGDLKNVEKYTNWAKTQLDKNKIIRIVKIQSIPRLFKNIKQASYKQAADMLSIDKKQVQGYIIQAVRLGIMKAKLDEYQQTIIINKLNLRCLQKSQQIQLQKQIINLCNNLSQVK